jgi:hypothetical protein
MVINPRMMATNAGLIAMNPCRIAINAGLIAMNPSMVAINVGLIAMNPSMIAINVGLIAMNPGRERKNLRSTRAWADARSRAQGIGKLTRIKESSPWRSTSSFVARTPQSEMDLRLRSGLRRATGTPKLGPARRRGFPFR